MKTVDEKAAAEIKGLSEDTRRYLQHKLRNGLQSIISSIEIGSPESASECVASISDELRKMGL